MRVLLVSHQAPPHIGGVENLVLMEAEGLIEDGHEVVWITSDGTGSGREVASGERLRIVRVGAWHVLERAFGIAYPFFSPMLPFRLWREVGRADLVHVHGLVFPGSPLAAVFARMRGRRVLCTDHGGLLRYPSRLAMLALRLLFATMGRVTARCAHKLIAYNGDVEALLVRLSGNRDKVVFLRNPVDRAMFQPPDPATRAAARAQLGWDERPRVLCVSRLLSHKGIDILLAARDPSFELVFCGPGGDDVRAEMRAQGAQCLDPRPQEEVLQLYQAADVFALPSHNEGFPIVLQEALACGLPVVTSDSPAYESYRGTPGLHLCEPEPAILRATILDVLQARRSNGAASPAAAPTTIANGRDERQRWLRTLCGSNDPGAA